MIPNCCTGRYNSDQRRRQLYVAFSRETCVDAHFQHSHTLKWHIDTLMATAVVLGTAPTLTPISGGPILDSNIISQPTKRSSEGTRYLKSMTGHTLHIWPNGTVKGLKNSIHTSRDYAILEFITTFATLSLVFPPKDVPKVRIKGVKSKLWLCMNSRGILYAGKDQSSQDCEFYQEYKREFSTLYSVLHHPASNGGRYYVALNRNGKPRKRMTTVHKSSLFKTTNAEKASLPPSLLASQPIFSTKAPTYKRAHAIRRSRHNIQDNPRHIKNRERSSKRNKNKSRLAKVLTSIEEQLAKPLPSLHSDPAVFQNSMLIDLGADNPFLDITNSEKIRHEEKKRTSNRGKNRRKPSYSRQRPTKSN